MGQHTPHIPEVEPRLWEVRPFNYDNCAAAMMTLFAVQTSEGWVAILQDSMSSTYEDEGPIPWFRTEMAIFYIVYFVVFLFFFVNIFVALVIVTFNELGEAELTEDIDKNQVRCSPAFFLFPARKQQSWPRIKPTLVSFRNPALIM